MQFSWVLDSIHSNDEAEGLVGTLSKVHLTQGRYLFDDSPLFGYRGDVSYDRSHEDKVYRGLRTKLATATNASIVVT